MRNGNCHYAEMHTSFHFFSDDSPSKIHAGRIRFHNLIINHILRNRYYPRVEIKKIPKTPNKIFSFYATDFLKIIFFRSKAPPTAI